MNEAITRHPIAEIIDDINGLRMTVLYAQKRIMGKQLVLERMLRKVLRGEPVEYDPAASEKVILEAIQKGLEQAKANGEINREFGGRAYHLESEGLNLPVTFMIKSLHLQLKGKQFTRRELKNLLADKYPHRHDMQKVAQVIHSALRSLTLGKILEKCGNLYQFK